MARAAATDGRDDAGEAGKGDRDFGDGEEGVGFAHRFCRPLEPGHMTSCGLTRGVIALIYEISDMICSYI